MSRSPCRVRRRIEPRTASSGGDPREPPETELPDPRHPDNTPATTVAIVESMSRCPRLLKWPRCRGSQPQWRHHAHPTYRHPKPVSNRCRCGTCGNSRLSRGWTSCCAGLSRRGVPPEWDLKQKPGGSVNEILKDTKPANPAGTEKRDPCAPPREPWTECRNRRLHQCTQTLSPFGTAICNYHERCIDTGRHC
jgi:hypothetical protein